jgi:hypothetical protein
MFPTNSAQLASQSVDTTGYWPIHIGQFTAPDRPVLAAVTTRPGMDLVAFCWTYGGPDATNIYQTFFHSLAHPNDAAWQAAGEQEAAARAAQPAAPAPAPAPAAADPHVRQRH